MNIVVLDGYTLNPGDLNWKNLEALGECRIYERTSPDDVVNRSLNAEIILTNKTPLTGDDIRQLNKLKYIGVLATGYNIVNIEAAKKRNILVTNVPTYGTDSVAQQTFAHILNFTNRIAQHSKSVFEGTWSSSKDWCYWDYPLIELSGLTLGIIGFGRIGQAVAQLGLAFGMKILFYDPQQLAFPENVKKVDLEKLFKESDIVTLHCPLTDETEGFVNTDRLKLMKKTAFLINTSRGQLINEKDLADSLNNDKIAGAGLDVLPIEPPELNDPLLRAKHCFITPHNSWATKASRTRLMDAVIDNLKAFLNHKPKNVVNL